ncbi:hypothetical protein OG252_49585 [Streptomyces sp. NBC_01352]|uniref:hypothetical protein n=1 Tax=Streptomyces sp. NBC_01373 TaxID=2903843 RepID=UPI002250E50C|nr:MULTISPECIES: hypothetical protein [unclassified Streptomyces]MCX4703954.1 hypothetical protein [Streptomyces sp. NBC_01373]
MARSARARPPTARQSFDLAEPGSRYTYLSAVLLVGLVLNATLGWSWADPVAALVIAAIAAIAVIAVKEARDAWPSTGCCTPSAATGSAAHAGRPGRGPAPGARPDRRHWVIAWRSVSRPEARTPRWPQHLCGRASDVRP